MSWVLGSTKCVCLFFSSGSSAGRVLPRTPDPGPRTPLNSRAELEKDTKKTQGVRVPYFLASDSRAELVLDLGAAREKKYRHTHDTRTQKRTKPPQHSAQALNDNSFLYFLVLPAAFGLWSSYWPVLPSRSITFSCRSLAHCSLHCSLVCPSYSHHLSPLLSPPSTHHAPTPTLASPPIPKRKLSNGHDRRMDQAIHFRIAAVLIATTTIIALLLFTMNRSKFMGDCREEPSRADGDGDA